MSLNVRFGTARAVEPVSLAELKTWVGQTSSEDDERLELVLQSAIDNIEAYCSRSLGVRTVIAEWRQPQKLIYDLPYGPVVTLTTVKRVYQDGTTDTLTENTGYYIEGVDDIRVRMNTYWNTSTGTQQTGLRFTYQAGYSRDYSLTTTKIPEALRVAVMKQAGYQYEYMLCNPGGGYLTELSMDVLKAIGPYMNAKLMV